MLKPQSLKTPCGGELVVLELAHYEALQSVATAAQDLSLNMATALATLRALEASFEEP